MEYQVARHIVESAGRNHHFKVTTNDGRTERKRLFISTSGDLCEFFRGSRTRGKFVTGVFWADIQPVRENSVRIFRRNLDRAVKYLEASGLWDSWVKDFRKLQTLSDEWILAMKDAEYTHRQQELRNEGINFISESIFDTLYDSRCIRTVNWGDYEQIRENFSNALKVQEPYSFRWHASYDNSIEYEPRTGRAWYSEEYKGCGNGHYYFLLDATHCAFREDD